MVYGKELEDLLNQGFRYAWSLTHDGDDAFDLVQTSYLKLLEKGKPLVASYLIRTIRNLHIDQKRKEKLKISRINSKKNSTGSYEIKVPVEPYLEKALERLPSSTREILFLSVVQEYSAQEISDLLNIPRGTILSTIHRAKRKLNEVLKEMKMEELEDKLRSYYQSKKLTTGQVKSILDQKPGNLRASNLFHTALKYAAVFIFLLGLSYIAFYLPYQKQKTILDNFAVEIIYNHQKNLPPEFRSQNIDELNQKLSKLDFELILPGKITDGKTLVGARYCSVDNRIAAQLKFINKTGQEETCYVFRNHEKFSFDEDIEKQGVVVTLWNTQKLVFALARDK